MLDQVAARLESGRGGADRERPVLIDGDAADGRRGFLTESAKVGDRLSNSSRIRQRMMVIESTSRIK